VFTLPLHRNGNSSVAAWVFVAARMCLATRCLAMDIHVTTFYVSVFTKCIGPSSRKMVPGSTQPLTEMSTRNLPGGKERTTGE
jgi:hypothetical protein